MAFKKSGQTVLSAVDAVAFAGGRGDATAQNLSLFAADSMNGHDAAASSTNAFLISELEKRDPLVRKPLTNFTWEKNIPVRTGGGYVDTVSNLTIDYGSAGDDDDANVAAGGSDVQPTIQGNFNKDTYKTHLFIQPVSINEIDMLRQSITGRSLDTLLGDGVRLHYEKHMDKNVFLGLAKYGTYGILNNPNVYRTTVAAGASTKTTWKDKTPDEILTDINGAITYTWGQAGNDMTAIPNHVLLPFEQYNYIATTKVSQIAEKTILTFILENNIAKINGGDLKFGVSLYGKGAGTGATDRMAVYVHDPKFIAVDELQPLTRFRTTYQTLKYITPYVANVSEVELFYPQTISYWDGI